MTITETGNNSIDSLLSGFSWLPSSDDGFRYGGHHRHLQLHDHRSGIRSSEQLRGDDRGPAAGGADRVGDLAGVAQQDRAQLLVNFALSPENQKDISGWLI